MRNLHRLHTKNVCGQSIVCLPVSCNRILQILQEQCNIDASMVHFESVVHNIDESTNPNIGSAINEGFNFHRDGHLISNNFSLVWNGCVTKTGVSSNQCATLICNDEKAYVQVDEIKEGELPEGPLLSFGHLPLEHICFVNFAMMLHSPPSTWYLREHVAMRVFIDIQLYSEHPQVVTMKQTFDSVLIHALVNDLLSRIEGHVP